MAISEYNVSIDFTGLGDVAPADGTIDPSTVEQYRANVLTTGASFGTVNVGDVAMINNFPVTFTGTAIADVVADINALSHIHHAVASEDGGNLALQNEPLYTLINVSVCDGTHGITAELGFDAPTKATQAQPADLDESLAKKRGNLRWNNMIARMSQTATVNSIHGVIVTGATLFSVDPTSIEFNIVFDSDSVYSYNIDGNLVYGAEAVKAAIAQSLMDSDTLVVNLYDPTNNIPTPPPTIPVGMSALSVTFGALTDDAGDAMDAVTVTPVV